MKIDIEVKELDINLDIETIKKKMALEASKELKNISPRRTGQYALGWTYINKNGDYIIYNEKRPTLTHLLEYGHLTRNGKKRIAPNPHIRPVFEKYAKLYVEEAKKIEIEINIK